MPEPLKLNVLAAVDVVTRKPLPSHMFAVMVDVVMPLACTDAGNAVRTRFVADKLSVPECYRVRA